MKSLRNKVIMSAIVLAFALVATIGSTYAWFTVSQTVTASNITLTAQSGESLVIRLYNNETLTDPLNDYPALTDAANYVQQISSYTGTIYENMTTWKIMAATAAADETAGLTDYTSLNPKALRYMSDLSDGTPTRTLTAVTGGNQVDGYYIDIRFWVMSQTQNSDIVLQDLNISSATAIEEAVRVATWVVWDGVTEADVNATSTPSVFSYDNNSGLDVGNDYAFAFTTLMTGYMSTASYNTIPNLASPDDNQDQLVGLQRLWYASGTGTEITNISTETLALAQTVASLLADTPSLINVRIYIEGWDAQTVNAVLGSEFSVSFTFMIQDHTI